MASTAFQSESEMTPIAQRWLELRGLMTKSEFVNPWGVCDLVGCSFNEHRAMLRLSYGQRAAIGPPLRISLLLSIPDHTTRESISITTLAEQLSGIVDERTVATEVSKLESLKFVQRTRFGQLQKINGWMPLQNELVTVELKLSRIQDAIEQAAANRWLTSNSFVGVPYKTATRIAQSSRKRQFIDLGLGLLGVTRSYCRALISPMRKVVTPNKTALTHCVERFWRTYLQTLHH